MTTHAPMSLRSQVATLLRLHGTIAPTPTTVNYLETCHTQLYAATKELPAALTPIPSRILPNSLVATYYHQRLGPQYALLFCLEHSDLSPELAYLLAAYSKATWWEQLDHTITGFAQTIVVVNSSESHYAIKAYLSSFHELKTCLDAGLITIWPRYLVTSLNLPAYKPLSSNDKAHTVLLLGYDPYETKLYKLLKQAGCTVDHWAEPVTADFINRYDLVLSYGYRHLLKSDLLATLKHPIINLHISLLPFNRGDSPNFWSFYDNSPSGVSIHLIDPGTDTGPVLWQQLQLWSAPKLAPDNALQQCYTRYGGTAVGTMNFASSYQALRSRIEDLFATNLDAILRHDLSARPQNGRGTYHKTADFPASFSGYDATVAEECTRLHQECTQASSAQ